MDASCLHSYAGTVSRLRKQQLEDEKKIMFLCKFLVKSQRHIIGLTQKVKPTLHRKLAVHGILLSVVHAANVFG